MVQFKELLHKL